MDGLRYPGQWVLGNAAMSSGRAGIPKVWSKIRLLWCQSRNGSQLGVRSKVKGIRLSAMMIWEFLLSFRGVLLCADQEPLGLSGSVFLMCCLPLSWELLYAMTPPLINRTLPSDSSPIPHASRMFYESTRISIYSGSSTGMESNRKTLPCNSCPMHWVLCVNPLLLSLCISKSQKNLGGFCPSTYKLTCYF